MRTTTQGVGKAVHAFQPPAESLSGPTLFTCTRRLEQLKAKSSAAVRAMQVYHALRESRPRGSAGGDSQAPKLPSSPRSNVKQAIPRAVAPGRVAEGQSLFQHPMSLPRVPKTRKTLLLRVPVDFGPGGRPGLWVKRAAPRSQTQHPSPPP
ncbi:unnamed protein product [Cutaneotrichosporon oleaginosum]